jgi:hypothetical protein
MVYDYPIAGPTLFIPNKSFFTGKWSLTSGPFRFRTFS